MENQEDFILIAGGTGLIGERLKKVFLENGYRVGILTRTPKDKDHYSWDPARKTIDKKILGEVTVLINLSGAGIADKRWTKERKEELYFILIGNILNQIHSGKIFFLTWLKNGKRERIYLMKSTSYPKYELLLFWIKKEVPYKKCFHLFNGESVLHLELENSLCLGFMLKTLLTFIYTSYLMN